MSENILSQKASLGTNPTPSANSPSQPGFLPLADQTPLAH